MLSRNMKTAAWLYHFQATPPAASNDVVLAATTLTTSTQTVTSGITNPAVPRALSVTGNAAGITGNVVITGKNIKGDTITETFALSGTSTVQGSKAFATVRSIQLPAKTNASGDTVSVGTTNKIGLPFAQPHNRVIATYYNNVLEGTAPTVAVNSAVESNTVTLNTALAGAVVDVYVIV